MKDFVLVPHPTFRPDYVTSLIAKVSRLPADELLINYELVGNIQQICLPPATKAVFSDGLWQHTCFELFISSAETKRYYEFNFSPSTQWAAYRFSDYRKTESWQSLSVPKITSQTKDSRLMLSVEYSLQDCDDCLNRESLRSGITAVIEDVRGKQSYWALKHPVAQPDFHHRAGFIASLFE